MNINVYVDRLIRDPLPFSNLMGLMQNAAPRITHSGKRIVVIASFEDSLVLDDLVQKIVDLAKRHRYISLPASEKKGGQELVLTLKDFYRLTDLHFEQSGWLKIVAKIIKPPLNRQCIEKDGFLEEHFKARNPVGESHLENINHNVLRDVLLPQLSFNDILSLAYVNSFMKSRIEPLLYNEYHALQRNTFGKNAWLKIPGIMDVGEEPPIPEDFYRRWFLPCPFFEGKKVYETHCLVLVPENFNYNPYTINSLCNMFKRFSKNILWIRNCESLRGYHKQAEKSHWLFMPKNVVGPDIQAFKINYEKIESKGYRALNALEATASTFILRFYNRINLNKTLSNGQRSIVVRTPDQQIEYWWGQGFQRITLTLSLNYTTIDSERDYGIKETGVLVTLNE